MKSFLIVLLTTFLFWGPIFSFWFYKQGEERAPEEIAKIATLSSSSEELKTEAIVEWLNLSVEKKMTLETFNLREGVQNLLKSLVILQAKIYKLPPSALVVSYTLREPLAYVLNWKNCAVDEAGVLFPLPHFSLQKSFRNWSLLLFPHLATAQWKGSISTNLHLQKRFYRLESNYIPGQFQGLISDGWILMFLLEERSFCKLRGGKKLFLSDFGKKILRKN